MEIILNRQVKVDCKKVLATVDVEQPRPDLQKILVAASEQGLSTFPDRLISYLEKENLIEGEQLTEQAHHTKQTGMFSTKERGIYHIWYFHDQYLGIHPIAMLRWEPPRNRSYHEQIKSYGWPSVHRRGIPKELHCNSTNVYLIDHDGSVDKRLISNLKIEVLDDKYRTNSPSIETQLRYTLGRNKSAQAAIQIQGNLSCHVAGKERHFSVSRKDIIEAKPEFLHDVAGKLEFAWEPEFKRMRCDVSDKAIVRSEFLIRKRPVNEIDTCYGHFFGGELINLPVMPKNPATANLWHEAWLNDTYREDYLSPDESRYLQRCWINHPAVKPYNLSLKEGLSLLQVLNRQQNPQGFWHASAGHYLIPSASHVQQPRCRWAEGDKLSVETLVRHLVSGVVVTGLIYSDRYYQSRKNERNLSAIAQSCSCDGGVIFSVNKKAKLPSQKWALRTMEKRPENHDRYWIFLTTGEPVIWTCTSSLDFIDFGEEEPEVRGTPTFTRLRNDELPSYLTEMLSEPLSKEYV
ncbi:hypothetical protein [Endozoicomonas euniceicola]|uniref:Uncharacterized protein n=1 Tax=Endozoicomonas euniceicola TaxID=1234143 RepID=A0ABY6GV16_9GAMM|nr:hypothetical protein [Endozoicomonas euniceicola]UYM15901.1 hypothetical protein NX720_24290 [Endozoicomonas euniceicola]